MRCLKNKKNQQQSSNVTLLFFCNRSTVTLQHFISFGPTVVVLNPFLPAERSRQDADHLCLFLLSHMRGWARDCTSASRPGWMRGPKSTSPATWTPRPISGWWAKDATACCPAPPAATRRSYTSWISTSTASNTAHPARRLSRLERRDETWDRRVTPGGVWSEAKRVRSRGMDEGLLMCF